MSLKTSLIQNLYFTGDHPLREFVTEPTVTGASSRVGGVFLVVERDAPRGDTLMKVSSAVTNYQLID